MVHGLSIPLSGPEMKSPLSVLFVCTGNSARSILSEATLNHLARGRFVAFSAGSKPTGAVNPGALKQLERSGIAVEGLRSKSWDEFTGDHAPEFDIVVTVCDRANGEQCPVFFGGFVRTHWPQPDPAEVGAPAEAVERAFAQAHRVVINRVRRLLDLPLESIPRAEWRAALDRIGHSE
jgi:protein-tyrosine-phosphatase